MRLVEHVRSRSRQGLVLAAVAALSAVGPASTGTAAGATAEPATGQRTVTTPDAPPWADGKIAFVRGGKIRTIDPDGTDAAVLTSSRRNSSPSWSPDGGQIAYVHEDRSGGRDLWVMQADGSARTKLTTDGNVAEGSPAWSPDGSSLAYGGTCMSPAEEPEACQWYAPETSVLNVVSAVAPFGSPTTALADPDLGAMDGPINVSGRLAWSPQGDKIAVRSDNYPQAGDQYILRYGASTGSVEVLDMIGYGGLEGTIANPTLSPNGGLMAWDARVDAQGEVYHRGIQMCDVSRATCDLFRQVDGDNHLTFAPSGQGVVLVRTTARDRLVLASTNGTGRATLTKGSQPSWQPLPARPAS